MDQCPGIIKYSLTAWIRLALLSSALVTLLPFCLRPCPWLCSLQPSSGILLTRSRSSIRYSYNFGYFSRIRCIWQGRFQIGRLGCSLWLPGPRSRSKINQKHGSWSADIYDSAGAWAWLLSSWMILEKPASRETYGISDCLIGEQLSSFISPKN